MSFGSPADIIPFTRFLDYRQRRLLIAAARATAVRAASHDGSVRPDAIETSNGGDGASPRVTSGQPSTRRRRTAAKERLNVRCDVF
jgi:hypothetical protein